MIFLIVDENLAHKIIKNSETLISYKINESKEKTI